MQNGRIVDPDEAIRLRRAGWSLDDIANSLGVEADTVYRAIRRHGGPVRQYVRAEDVIPWRGLTQAHRNAKPYRMLRLWARRRANWRGGLDINEGLSASDVRRLDRWLREELQDGRLVVAFDPNRPPNPASPKVGGWYYTARSPQDGNALIRPPDSA